MNEPIKSFQHELISENVYEGWNEKIMRIDVDENTFLYTYIKSWWEYDKDGNQIGKDEKVSTFVPKIKETNWRKL